jgi:anti-anti-sigma factor
MEFKLEKTGDVGIIYIFLTRATLAKAVAFKEFVSEIIESGSNKLIVDLSICEYIDSTFLGAMVALLKKTNIRDGDLRLVYNKEIPSLLFVLTRMDKVFKTFPNLDEALASFNISGIKPTLNWK